MPMATKMKAPGGVGQDHDATGRVDAVAAVRALYEHVTGEGTHDESVGEDVYWTAASLQLPAGLARDISLLLPPRYRPTEVAPVRIGEVLGALDRLRQFAGIRDTSSQPDSGGSGPRSPSA